jgi:hypothetical protein
MTSPLPDRDSAHFPAGSGTPRNHTDGSIRATVAIESVLGFKPLSKVELLWMGLAAAARVNGLILVLGGVTTGINIMVWAQSGRLHPVTVVFNSLMLLLFATPTLARWVTVRCVWLPRWTRVARLLGGRVYRSGFDDIPYAIIETRDSDRRLVVGWASGHPVVGRTTTRQARL